MVPSSRCVSDGTVRTSSCSCRAASTTSRMVLPGAPGIVIRSTVRAGPRKGVGERGQSAEHAEPIDDLLAQ